MASVHGLNQRIADRLVLEGRITPDDHRRAVEYAMRTRGRIEDAIIELDIVNEAELLKFIATVHNTRFVSTEKLSKAIIEPRVLAKVSAITATLHGVFPVLLDERNTTLSVATADPDNDAALHEIRLAAGVRDVRAIVARPAAVRAAIAYHYRGDTTAFNSLLRPVSSFDEILYNNANNNPFERTSAAHDRASMTHERASIVHDRASMTHVPVPPHPQVMHGQTMHGQTMPGQTMHGPMPGQAMPGQTMHGPMPGQPMPGQPMPGQTMHGQAMHPQPAHAQPAHAQVPLVQPMHTQTMHGQPAHATPAIAPIPVPLVTTPAAPAVMRAPSAPPRGTTAGPPPTPVPPSPPAQPQQAAPVSAPVAPPPPHPTTSHAYVETLNVLVSLLENNRQDLRGHSSTVARIVRKLCERIGLPATTVASYVASAYLHDLGKNGPYHLTALNVAEYEGHRLAATKSVDLPAHLMESVGLPQEVVSSMSLMYERYDGSGFPDGLSGKEIPLGARILAVADTYADLTQNPRNPYRKALRPAEACDVLAQYRDTIFDPNIVDLFRQVMTGDDMRAKLLSNRHQALIVDPDPEETTVLELRLLEQGFEVSIARNVAQARRELETKDIEVVVSEIDLEEPDAGLALRADALKLGFGRDKTWVILTAKTDRQTAQRAFDLGVDDFVSKPASTDVMAAKLRQLIERRSSTAVPRGVSGSLAEMGLPDMVQILWHGRKTCALKIQSNSMAGEIHFADGQVVHALWAGAQGEDAFYRMLTLREGDFRLDPSFSPSTRSITASPEALLLEGMRRLDEGTLS
ncbi:HD domain-containing phosphohydrolase [Sorangium sp. So ce1024]|uniref:HD domain-containing phosphohydrolase n=1 Tax=Sorangium sp. So ce1024 TaxID=3133327 RepID=UPI003EFD0CA6